MNRIAVSRDGYDAARPAEKVEDHLASGPADLEGTGICTTRAVGFPDLQSVGVSGDPDGK